LELDLNRILVPHFQRACKRQRRASQDEVDGDTKGISAAHDSGYLSELSTASTVSGSSISRGFDIDDPVDEDDAGHGGSSGQFVWSWCVFVFTV
jgi:hypothetical protein